MTDQADITWRIIDTGALSGPENMAIDEALLNSFDPFSSMPLLRLYGWEPPALSLGRFQKACDVLDIEKCRNSGIAVVRRVTGGGVIYHCDELTYSLVCAPSHIPPSSSVKDSFRVLTGFLLRFYRLLGLNPVYAVENADAEQPIGERTPFCFAGRESFDILLSGKKSGGNAQRRMKNIIFQHGSIPLVSRIKDGVQYLRETPDNLESSVTDLSAQGISHDPEYLKNCLIQAFREHFSMSLQNSRLTEEENALGIQLLNSKYLSDDWNLDGVINEN